MQTNIENEYDNYNLQDDLNNGNIYLIKNRTNNKCYIGQALCYTGLNNNKWGTFGRWKSHIREALKTDQDHCVALNNAIRKYGADNFDITTLMKCHKDELDEYEVKFVKEYDSIQPNGYNIKYGGYSSKNNETTIQKMKEAHTGHIHSEEQKINISKGQMGNRRNGIKRKNEEDNDLPKYIKAVRENNKVTAFMVGDIPIGINTKKYTNKKLFSITKNRSKEDTLILAKEFLQNELEKYKYIEEDIKIIKEEEIKQSIKESKENKITQKLPEYIYPIIEDNKIAGYYVEGIVNNEGNFYSKRIFNNNTNRWNLDKSIKFIEILKYINEHNVDLNNMSIDDIDINDVSESFYEKYYLPKYFNIFRRNNEVVGFCINGFPSDKHKGGKYKKEFRFKTQKGIRTMDETYLAGIEYLSDLKNGNITL